MLEQLKNAAIHIAEISARTREEAEKLRKSEILLKDWLEKNLINPVEECKIEGKVCAVDGGLLFQEMHGVDLIIGRAAGVVFEYSDSKLIKSEYYPRAFPTPEYKVEIGLDEQEANAFKSLFRLNLEIGTAIKCLEKYSPKILMLDGSVVPLSQDKPQKESSLYPEYIKLIGLYKELYSLSEKKNCLLLGVIKDSRGRRFMEELKSVIEHKSADTVFLNYLLREKERTTTIKYSTDSKKHIILNDLEEWGEKINLFYLKSVKNDRPMRVEFLSTTHSYKEIASLVYSLSKINDSYAYPAILIEADLRAMIDEKEMERMQKTLQMLSFDGVQPLRRNSRPFR